MRPLLLAIAGALAGCGRIDFGDADPGIPDLVVVYPMDAIHGADVPATVPALDGTCATCPTVVPGVHGNAYQFDGTQMIDLPPGSSTLVGAAPFTATVWLRVAPDPGPNQRTILAKPLSATSVLNVLAFTVLPTVPTSDGDVRYESVSDSLAPQYLVATDHDVATSTWRHVAVRWDGVSKAIFIDGILATSTADSIVDSTEPLFIGVDLDNNFRAYRFTGALDELRFYSRALGDDEIQLLAQLP
jgi:hypothetical protein